MSIQHSLCPLKEIPNQDLSWPENVNQKGIFSHMQAWYGCSINRHAADVVFLFVAVVVCFKLELLRVQPCYFTLYQRKSGNGWLMQQNTLLPFTLLSFMMSHTQIAKYKMAALKQVFLQLSNAMCCIRDRHNL